MAWNGSKGKNTDGTSAAKRPVGGAKKSPSIMRGAFAALAVVVLAAGAWWWFGGREATTSPVERPTKTKVVQPPQRPVTLAPKAKPKPLTKEERRAAQLQEIRDKFGGGLNAHNGLRSIKAKLGTADFGRVRVGIGRPPGKMSVADWALRKLKGSFAEEFQVTCEQAADVVEQLLG